MEKHSLASVERQLEPHAVGNEHHQQILANLFKAILSADEALVRSCLTENCDFAIHGWPALDGVCRGRDQVASTIVRNFSQISEQVTDIAAAIHQGNMAAMRLHETGRLNGSPYQTQGVIWLKFEDGLISSIDEVLVTT